MPLIELTTIENGSLLLWDMSETQDELRKLGEEFTADPAFLCISHPRRQREWLTIQLLLRQAGCKGLLHYNENGKPCINHSKYKSVSISHSTKLAGLFLHPEMMSGLDIESAERNFAKVEKKFLNSAESKLARQIPDGPGLFWCMKEAAYKAAGIPGLIFNKQIEIKPNTEGDLMVSVVGRSTLNFKIYRRKIAGQLIVCLTLLSSEPFQI